MHLIYIEPLTTHYKHIYTINMRAAEVCDNSTNFTHLRNDIIHTCTMRKRIKCKIIHLLSLFREHAYTCISIRRKQVYKAMPIAEQRARERQHRTREIEHTHWLNALLQCQNKHEDCLLRLCTFDNSNLRLHKNQKLKRWTHIICTLHMQFIC